jgi:hypothetical protein
MSAVETGFETRGPGSYNAFVVQLDQDLTEDQQVAAYTEALASYRSDELGITARRPFSAADFAINIANDN